MLIYTTQEWGGDALNYISVTFPGWEGCFKTTTTKNVELQEVLIPGKVMSTFTG